jgi:hypothetical protein
MKMWCDELIDLVNSLQAGDLDELVYDMKSSEASNINNGGVETQIRYLLSNGMSLEELKKAIETDIIQTEIGNQE